MLSLGFGPPVARPILARLHGRLRTVVEVEAWNRGLDVNRRSLYWIDNPRQPAAVSLFYFVPHSGDASRYLQSKRMPPVTGRDSLNVAKRVHSRRIDSVRLLTMLRWSC
jgi:hypothetical protein